LFLLEILYGVILRINLDKGANMSVYIDAVKELFEKLGIEPGGNFDEHVPKLRDTSYHMVAQSHMGTVGRYDLSEALTNFESSIRDLLRAPETIYTGPGIQQFGLSLERNIGAENVKKALFLSDLPTVFTGQRLSVEIDNSYQTEDINVHDITLELNEDFIRDLHSYWDVIESDDLVVLPESPSVDLKKGKDPSLGELRSTKVVDLGDNPELYKLVHSKYRDQRQVVLLPKMDVPYIRNVPLEEVMRIRKDYQLELMKFQESYHNSLINYMVRHKHIDFEKMSKQIHEDEIKPAVGKLEKIYKRIASQQKKSAAQDLIVDVIPISAAIVSATVFGYDFGDIPTIVASTLTPILRHVARYMREQEEPLMKLEEDTYFIVWKLSRS
jgi:hypothetical protein